MKQTNKRLTLAAIAAAGFLLIKKAPISGIGSSWDHGEILNCYIRFSHPDGSKQYFVKIQLDNGEVYEAITPSNSIVNAKLANYYGKKGWFDIRFANKWFVLRDVKWDNK